MMILELFREAIPYYIVAAIGLGIAMYLNHKHPE